LHKELNDGTLTLMKYLTTLLIAALFIGFSTAVYAASGIPSPETDLAGFFTALIDAFNGNDYTLVGGLAIIGVVAAIQRWGSKLIPAIASGKGAVAVTLGVGALLGIATALTAGGAITLASVLKGAVGGITTALVASGIFSQVKKVREVKEA